MSPRAVTIGQDFTGRLVSASSAHLADRQFGDVRAMRRALVAIRRQHGLSGESDIPESELEATISKLAAGAELTPREIRDCAFGIAVEVEGIGCILDRPDLAEALLARVETIEMHPRRTRGVVSGLLSGYLAYRPPDYAKTKGAWHDIREWLAQWLEQEGASDSRFDQLHEHRNLLTDEPCLRYEDPQQAAGDVEVLRSELGISPNSWVFGEILVAQVGHVCRQEDAMFHGQIDRFLGEVESFPAFAGQVIALLLTRYASSASQSEPQANLKEAALARWGNPLDTATHAAWRAVSAQTRRMVEGWVKRYVIELFFGAISARWATDSRRTDFWLRYVDEIEDLHLFFGGSAYDQNSRAFRELREAVAGKYSRMENDPENNGFMMVIGGIAFLEFSNHANACYVYDARDLPFDRARRVIPISLIKNQLRCLKRLIHRDYWESNFAYEIASITGRRRSGGGRS